MSNFRIAILCASFPPDACGGIGTSCFNLFSGLKKHGIEARVFTIASDNNAGLSGDIFRAKFPVSIKMLIPRLAAMWIKLRSGRGGLIYQFGDTMLGILYGHRLKMDIRNYAPDFLIVPDKGISSLLIKPPNNCKIIFVSHHNPMRFVNEPSIGDHSLLDAILAVKWQQKALKKVDGVICPSLYMKEMFVKTYSFTGPVAVISNVADIESISKVAPCNLHDAYKIPNDAPIVYIPSAGSLIKGSAFVTEIVKRLAEATIGTIGFYLSGNIRPELKELLNNAPANAKLIMPGRISYQENIAYMKGCSILVSPTILESFGMALLEAQACGLPCAAFAVGGNNEIIADGITGFLVPFLDIETLISKAIELCINKENIRSMGVAAEKRVKETYDPAAIIDEYIKFFISL